MLLTSVTICYVKTTKEASHKFYLTTVFSIVRQKPGKSQAKDRQKTGKSSAEAGLKLSRSGDCREFPTMMKFSSWWLSSNEHPLDDTIPVIAATYCLLTMMTLLYRNWPRMRQAVVIKMSLFQDFTKI